MSTTGIELNLPDLPEVPMQLGPSAAPPGPRPRVPWSLRLRDAVTAYLPLLLMVALALGTWWLVKNTPVLAPAGEARPPRAEPDYTMRGFTVQRFGADGRLLVQLEGRQLRHYPDSDRTEIDLVTVQAWAEDGRETVATARRAVASGDVSVVELLGGAQVRSRTAEGQPLEIDSDYLRLDERGDRVSTTQPVTVRLGANRVEARGLRYDRALRRLELDGPMRATFQPGSVRR